MAALTDTEAMDDIATLLDGRDWEVEDLDKIASIVNGTGRGIAEPGEHTREELIELLTDDWMLSSSQMGAFRSLLAKGHQGFDNMSYSELLKDAQDAELLDRGDD